MPKKEYAFVLDAKGQRLDPTIVQNAWRLLRQKKAVLISRFPMTIRLNRIVDDINHDEVRCGIDDGGIHVGVALVQKCQTRNKVLFKGTIEQRKDVKKLMTQRRSYRRKRRYEKRYRPARFDNRASSRRKGRLAPSIKQKRQAILRVVDSLVKHIRINSFYLEDVAIDIRVLTDGHRLYHWQYQKSNRLDENIRKAVVLRDHCKCQICKAKKGIKEVHHITPRRLGGADTLSNLITLCPKCHAKVTGQEEKYAPELYAKIGSEGNNFRLRHAQHSMQGKTWLRAELSNRSPLDLTTGGDTANHRIDWGIEKSHANDAVCITGLKPESVDIQTWAIKPIRRQSKAQQQEVCGFRHHDIVAYIFRNGERHEGYVTAMYPDGYFKAGKPQKAALNFQSPTKHCKRANARKCKLVFRPSRIYWLKCV